MRTQIFACGILLFVLFFMAEKMVASPFYKEESNALQSHKKNNSILSLGAGIRLITLSCASAIKSPLFKNTVGFGAEMVCSHRFRKNFYFISNIGMVGLGYDEQAFQKPETFIKITDGALYDTHRGNAHAGILTIGTVSEALSYRWYSKIGLLQPFVRLSLYAFDYNIEKLFYRTHASSSQREYIYLDAHRSKWAFAPSVGAMYLLPLNRIADLFVHADFGYLFAKHSYKVTIYSSDGSEEKYKQPMPPLRTVGNLSIGLKFKIYKYLNY
nr:hypothetical protein [Chitinophagaceae bacterium]